MTRVRRFGAITALGLLTAPALAQSPSGPCRPFLYEDARYTVCTIDLRKYQLKLFWRAPDGEPYNSFERLAQAHRDLAFAMNAGMYHKDWSPVGLYVEDGRELKKANTANGPGNFHMKPNGVFYANTDSAGVAETGRYLRQKPKAEIATQSGPMLVIDGRIHPKISEEGVSRKMRNGVGVRNGKTVVFAISEELVTFGQFARLFRDALGCSNALFLDGSVSSLYAPALNRADARWPMGPIIGAVERTPRR
ncbi:MAG TPA: phosphodiester glycosidase family protein [Beijerinckiaceae bacterium]|jgi:prepilin-type processing-associated H-X9-DG protein|nr:putative periplasmic protein [Microvirga sp.]HZB39303.1 phosphodiester glycosidase family protein [Beijerinckiaceae bacterium]